MKFPRMYMGITDLAGLTGLSKDYLKTISRAKDAPIVRTCKGGKIYFKTDEFDAFIKNMQQKRK
jgi:hypothetical protein